MWCFHCWGIGDTAVMHFAIDISFRSIMKINSIWLCISAYFKFIIHQCIAMKISFPKCSFYGGHQAAKEPATGRGVGLLLASVLVFLVRQQDKDSTEQVDEINEQVHAVPDDKIAREINSLVDNRNITGMILIILLKFSTFLSSTRLNFISISLAIKTNMHKQLLYFWSI